MYSAECEIDLPQNPNYEQEISVTMNRTFEAAQKLLYKYQNERIAVLNFDSATNPGGGVVNGARAQEESLCRCSTLYPCLNQKYLGIIITISIRQIMISNIQMLVFTHLILL